MTNAPLPLDHPIARRHPDIARLVCTFYDRARLDPLIGPVFEAAVQDWPHHLAALTAFWAAQLRGRGSYRGHPMAAHRRHRGQMRQVMFHRWLAIWRRTTTELMPPEEAAILQAKAERMAQALMQGLWEDDLPTPAGAA